ncbi:MAG: hypothetical protein WC848_06465 [Parcubacteria group bacterium]|jgi:hypothetical protein
MANINLVTDKEETKMMGMGTSVLLAVFFLVILIYCGLFFYGKKLSKDTDALTAAYSAKRSSFIVGDSKRVLDFQNRLSISNDLLAQERNANQNVVKVEESMIAGVYLSAYEYDDDTKAITLDCYADNYEMVAKQILSFKSSDYFTSVLAGESEFDTRLNKISFTVVLKIK